MFIPVGSNMKLIKTNKRNIIQPCGLDDFNYQIDPYLGCEHGCHYCYTQNSFDWSDEIQTYENLKEKLTAELASFKPQKIYLGMNTDPYQPAEEEFRRTRKVLEVLHEHDFSVSILTKSNLVMRDVDILKDIPGASVGVSIAFQNDLEKKLFETNTVPNSDRISALKDLKREGIKTYALICPVMPYITDVHVLINQVRPYVDSIWIYPLKIDSVEDENWKSTRPILEQHFPDILEKFEEVVFSIDHVYWDELRRHLKDVNNDVVIRISSENI